MESEMTCSASEMWPKGLSFEISHHPKKMKSVVNLVIALERLKARSLETALGTEFRDENLLSIMLESIVEGDYTDRTVTARLCRLFCCFHLFI